MMNQYQQQNYDHIINSIDNYGHQIFLLYGSVLTNQEELAISIIKYLLCSNPQQNLACNHCSSCILNNNHNHPDLLKILANSGDNFVKIEILKKMLTLALPTTPQIAKKKIVYIPNFAQISEQGANCLLKTLEEPTPSTVFIIVTTETNIVLPTILSRCIKIKIEHSQQLTNQQQSNQQPINSDALDIIKNCMIKPSISNIFATSNHFDGKKNSFALFIDFFYKWLCYLMTTTIVSTSETDQITLELNYDFNTYDIKPLISKVNLNKLFDLQDKLSIFNNYLQHPLNYKLQVENILFNYQQCFYS